MFVYLKLLLLFDLIVITITICNRMSKHVCDYSHRVDDWLYRPCIYRARFLHHLLPRVESLVITMHFYLIAALTTHRYWKIARPFQSRLHDTKRRSYVILFGMLVAIVAYRLPTFILELKLTIVPTIRIVNDIWYTIVMSPYRIVYHSIVDPIVSNLLPFVWTAVFSALTLVEVYRATREPMLNDELLTVNNNSSLMLADAKLRIRLSRSSNKRRKSLERSEIRATLFIASIVNICLFCHSVQLYMIARKWHLLLSGTCPNRSDYVISSIETVLEIVSTSVNVFVFTGFTARLVSAISRKAKLVCNQADVQASVSPPDTYKTEATMLRSVEMSTMFVSTSDSKYSLLKRMV